MSAAVALSGRRKLSLGEIEMVLAAHERFITGRPGGKLAALRFIDFTGVDLSGRNLCDADLSASIFDGAKLVGTKLERANLFGCDLRKADLRRANLSRADLRGACLRGADLTQANLTQADFRVGQVAVPHPSKGLASLIHHQRSGELDHAKLTGATLDGSQLEEVSAFATDFTDCSLRGAKLNRANLKDANLEGAMMDWADVAGANLEGAQLADSVLTGVDIRKARTSGANLEGALSAPDQEAMDLAGDHYQMALANQTWCKTGGREGKPACFDGKDLRPLDQRLRGLRLSVMSAKGAILVGLGLATLDGEQVLLDLDGQLVGAEAGDGDLDPVGVIARALDVVGRIAAGGVGRGGFQQAGQTVEADDGAVERGKVESTHVRSHPSWLSKVAS